MNGATNARKGAVKNSEETVKKLIKPAEIEGGFVKLRAAIDGLAREGFPVVNLNAAAVQVTLSFHNFAELLEQCLVLAKDTKVRTARSIRLGQVLVRFQKRNSQSA